MSGDLAALRARVEAGSATAAVVGLGYVGLPVACLLAASGLDVLGVDVNAGRVARLTEGRSHIEGDEPGLAELVAEVVAAGRLRATTDPTRLADRDLVLVAVDTPVDPADHRPRYEALRSACADIGRSLRRGALVIVESTVGPGTVAGVVVPALEAASGMRAGDDFFFGHCPERVMPGRLLANLRTMSRVVGGATPEVAAVMAALYGRYVEGELDPTDVLTAELVKTAENAYRDVNIAFANELARICEAAGGDAWKVRELVNKSPGRNLLLPGGGVGGHCIPKDPWLLAAAAPEPATPLIRAARAVNDSMPAHVRDLAGQLLAEAGVDPAGAVVAVLGYAYLENSDDVRNSPSAALVELLRAGGSEVRIHDPFVPPHQQDLGAVLAGADVAILMVAHDAYRRLDPAALAGALRRPLLVDARRVFEPAALAAAGLGYRSLGSAPPPARRLVG